MAPRRRLRAVRSGHAALGLCDARALIDYEKSWDDPKQDELNTGWTRSALAAVERASRPRPYLNFPDLGEEGAEMLRASFGDN